MISQNVDSFHVDRIIAAMYTDVVVFICQRKHTLALSSSCHLDVTHKITTFHTAKGSFLTVLRFCTDIILHIE